MQIIVDILTGGQHTDKWWRNNVGLDTFLLTQLDDKLIDFAYGAICLGKILLNLKIFSSMSE